MPPENMLTLTKVREILAGQVLKLCKNTTEYFQPVLHKIYIRTWIL